MKERRKKNGKIIENWKAEWNKEEKLKWRKKKEKEKK